MSDTEANAVVEANTPTDTEPESMALSDLLQPTMDTVEAAGAYDGALLGIPTGFADFDRLTSGLELGSLTTVASAVGMGNTTLLLDIIRHSTLHHRQPAMFVTTEETGLATAMRIIAAEARVPRHVLRSGDLSDDDWTRVMKRRDDITKSPLHLVAPSRITVEEIADRAAKLKAQRDLKLLVVDELQDLDTVKPHQNRYERTAVVSRALKVTARELDIAVLVSSRLNRAPEGRYDKRPTLADLRDSGTIAEDSDIVILLHREDYYDKQSPRAGEADLIVVKHRNGAIDTLTVAHQFHLSRMVDMAV